MDNLITLQNVSYFRNEKKYWTKLASLLVEVKK